MNRLTIKNPFGYSNYKGIDITTTMECINKLGQLEDIEEELGIDLITFFNNYRELKSLKGRNLKISIEELVKELENEL